MVDFVAALAQGKAAYDALKAVIAAGKAWDEAEYKLKLANLAGQIQEMRSALLEAQESDRTKELRILELEGRLKFKGTMKYEAPFYLSIGADGERDGPFCQKCWDADEKPIRLQHVNHGRWHCAECKNRFDTEERKRYDADQSLRLSEVPTLRHSRY